MSRVVLRWAALLCICMPLLQAHAAAGRTAGSFSVAQSGSATYSVPIWTPPGPHGLQPSISLAYDSQAPNGVLGVGWHLVGLPKIARCVQNTIQDSNAAPITLTSADKFCLDGNRLRLASGVYGQANSTYQTEIADFSQISLIANSGGPPLGFKVQTKSGLTYIFGNSGDSILHLVNNLTPAYAWLLSLVTDRNGNSYRVSYQNSLNYAAPLTISWAPATSGDSSNYTYKLTFNYSNNRTDVDTPQGYVGGGTLTAALRVESIAVSTTASGAEVVKRKYRLTYDVAPITARSRLTKITECADDAEADCLSPTSFAYQGGQIGVTAASGSAPTSTSALQPGSFDFNGDHRDDLVYKDSSNWYVAFSSGTGFLPAIPVTGLAASANVVIDKFAPNGTDAFLVNQGGTLYTYTYVGSAFVATPQFAFPAGTLPVAVDLGGDRLADLVWLSSSVVKIRYNESGNSATVPSFSSSDINGITLGGTVTDNSRWGVGTYSPTAVSSRLNQTLGLRHIDVDGDGTQDVFITVQIVTSHGGGAYQFALRSHGSWFEVPPATSWSIIDPTVALINFNDDLCTDQVIGTNLYIAKCDGSYAAPLTIPTSLPILAFLDWDGDGRSDILVNNGGSVRVYRSAAKSFATPTSTSIPVISATYFAFDEDGDGYDDLGRVATSGGAVTFYTHTATGAPSQFATNAADVLSSVTDGLGVTYTPKYVYLAQSTSNYARGTATALPLQEPTRLPLVVGQLVSPNGIGGTYTTTYNYVGARNNIWRRLSAGFQEIDVTDQRNGIQTKTYMLQDFPRIGMVWQQDTYQQDGTQISHTSIDNVSTTIVSTAKNESYFVTAASSTTQAKEVATSGTAMNGQLITTSSISLSDFDSYGNPRTITRTVKDNDSTSPLANQQWTTTTSIQYNPADTSFWCIDLPTQIQVTHSTTELTDVVTRTIQLIPDSAGGSKCRVGQIIVEPSNAQYKVSTTLGYDAFGNINSSSSVGIQPDGTPETRASYFSFGTRGIYPETITNALTQSINARYDYDRGVLERVIDPNGLTTIFGYDTFGRPQTQLNPDGTTLKTQISTCNPCYGTEHKLTINESLLDTGGATITDQLTYLDRFERPLVTRAKLLANDGTYQWNEVQYNALGQIAYRGVPCLTSSTTTSCVPAWESFAYDAIGRAVSVTARVSESDSTTKTTIISYAGRTTTVTDPQSKGNSTIVDVNGWLRRTQDANNYYLNFNYDAAGALKSVVDKSTRTLFSASYAYGTGAFQTAAYDPDQGSRTYTYNSFGDLRYWTDNKGRTFSATYDALSRPRVIREPDAAPDLITTYIWGSDAASHNIGALSAIQSDSADGTYREDYQYDSLARISQQQITLPTIGAFYYNFDYKSSSGLPDTVTYPLGPSGYRLKLQYGYQNGILNSITNSSTGTSYWTLKEVNARAQPTKESLGSGIERTRLFDAVTGWLTSIKSGPSSTPTSIQNSTFGYDLVGNLVQRQTGIGSKTLTETFHYGNNNPTDNLYRLAYSTLNDGTNEFTNFSATYDDMGNVLTRSDTSGTGLPVGQKITWDASNYPTSIEASSLSEKALFSYGPGHQRWKMDFTKSGSSEKTYYIGPGLERVDTSSGTSFRYYIGAGEPLATYTPSSASSGTLRYLLPDAQGSIDAVVTGNTINFASFTAFGNRRDAATWNDPPSAADRSTLDGVTREGYTFQTVLGSMGLNHMNGRVQDAISGRFLSSDPFVTEPAYTQNFNRYSYVYNNPMSYVDPSGYAGEPTPGFGCLKIMGQYFRDLNTPGSDGYNNSGGSSSDPSIRCPAILDPMGIPGTGDSQRLASLPAEQRYEINNYEWNDAFRIGVGGMISARVSQAFRDVSGVTWWNTPSTITFCGRNCWAASTGLPNDKFGPITSTMTNGERISPILDTVSFASLLAPGPAEVAIAKSATEIIQEVAIAQRAKGIEYLTHFLSDADARLLLNPGLREATIGKAVHKATEFELRRLYPGRFEYFETSGMDFLDKSTGEFIELAKWTETTFKAWKYGVDLQSISVWW